jgi:glutamate racemase
MIGVFDSGVGGLSVWREIVRQHPRHDTVYLADQAHVPYGRRSLEEVREFGEEITRFLLGQGTEVIVLACNTASAAALHPLRATFPHVPFVGMEPAVKPATENTHTGVVGVIATQATFQGELFASLLQRFAHDVKVLTQICPGLVEMIEAGALDTAETESLLRDCLQPLLAAGIDQLVLGCTHYPFVRPTIERIAGPVVEVIDPAPAVARQVGRMVRLHGVEAGAGRHTFYTTGDPEVFTAMLERLIGLHTETQSIDWHASTEGILRIQRSPFG